MGGCSLLALHPADPFKPQILALGQLWIHCSIPVSFPSLYWISALRAVTVGFQIWHKNEGRKVWFAVLVNIRWHCRA